MGIGTIVKIAIVGAQFVWRHRHAIVRAHRTFCKHDTDLEKISDFIDSAPNVVKRS